MVPKILGVEDKHPIQSADETPMQFYKKIHDLNQINPTP